MSTVAEQVVHAIAVISHTAELTAFGTQNVSAAAEEQLASMEEISSSAASLSQMAEELQALSEMAALPIHSDSVGQPFLLDRNERLD